LIGAEGEPHGVVGVIVATCVKSAKEASPVPPMTAMRIGSVEKVSLGHYEMRPVVSTIVAISYARHSAMANMYLPYKYNSNLRRKSSSAEQDHE